MNTLEYFTDLDVNPYTFIGVKKGCSEDQLKNAYRKKAIDLHPDKTDGKTEFEFRLLKECYMYVKNSSVVPVEDSKGVRGRIPSEIFAPRQVRQPVSDVYVPYTDTVNIFNGGDFNRDQFNAAFELNKQKHNNTNFITDPVGFTSDSSLNPLDIITHGGLIIEKPRDESSFLNFSRVNTTSDITIKDLKETKEFKKILKQVKDKTIGCQPTTSGNRKSVETFESETRGLTREQANQHFYEKKIKGLKDEMDRNKTIMEKHLHVYPKEYINRYKIGDIEDSSTGKFPDTDPFLASFSGRQ